MYGEHGFCEECGIALHEQTGDLVLKPSTTPRDGAWVTHWRFVTCVSSAALATLTAAESLKTRPVQWTGSRKVAAQQLLPTVMAGDMFDHDELRRRITARHGKPGNVCQACGRWKWLPLGLESVLPAPREGFDPQGLPVVASREIFGDGRVNYREELWRRDVADEFRALSPRVFYIVEPGEPY